MKRRIFQNTNLIDLFIMTTVTYSYGFSNRADSCFNFIHHKCHHEYYDWRYFKHIFFSNMIPIFIVILSSEFPSDSKAGNVKVKTIQEHYLLIGYFVAYVKLLTYVISLYVKMQWLAVCCYRVSVTGCLVVVSTETDLENHLLSVKFSTEIKRTLTQLDKTRKGVSR